MGIEPYLSNNKAVIDLDFLPIFYYFSKTGV